MSLLEKEVLLSARKLGHVSVPVAYGQPKQLRQQEQGRLQASSRSSAQSAPQSPEAEALFMSFFRFMKQHHDISAEEVLVLFNQVAGEGQSMLEQRTKKQIKQHIIVPVEIFSTKLSPSEALCKFLKEEKHLTFHEIAVLINRDDRSIWTSYKRAQQKNKKSFTELLGKDFLFSSACQIPVSVFKARDLSILEHVVAYLKQHEMKNKTIAQLLKKSPAVISTIIMRIKKKNKGDTLSLKGHSK